MSKFYLQSFVSFSLLFLCLITSVAVKADDPKPEGIIAKHFDSIGTKEKRAEIKNQMAMGTARFDVLRSPTYTISKTSAGRAVFLSEADKIFLGMKFESTDYPFDEILYDAKNVNVAYIKPGNRSVLGNFIISHRYLISEGLFGGSLSTAWSLFDWQSNGAKLKSGGKKKIGGRQTYAVNYLIKGGSPLSVKLYFDAENFRHLRTEYQQVFTAPMVQIPGESARQVQTIHQLTEDFSNFKGVKGLTLPHSYKVNLLIDGKLTNEFEWKYEFSEFLFNQKIDSKSFETK
jgi:hypothetical protein